MRVVGGHRDHGIGKDDEVGAAVLAIDGIRVGGASGVEVRGQRGGEVATSGETHEADYRWIDVEVPGAAADEAHGALGVAEFDGMVIAQAETVSEDERGDTHSVKPVSDLAAFVIGSYFWAEWINHHRREKVVAQRGVQTSKAG